ncbi:MAG: hypothetical protein Q8S54_12090 [Bacteroidota bacterium]|nr:hypothetical protein [Bacteroidota bacterium]
MVKVIFIEINPLFSGYLLAPAFFSIFYLYFAVEREISDLDQR